MQIELIKNEQFKVRKAQYQGDTRKGLQNEGFTDFTICRPHRRKNYVLEEK